MEVYMGQVDYGVKDDKGEFITPEACEHMAEFRVRCTFCEQNFCSDCKE